MQPRGQGSCLLHAGVHQVQAHLDLGTVYREESGRALYGQAEDGYAVSGKRQAEFWEVDVSGNSLINPLNHT